VRQKRRALRVLGMRSLPLSAFIFSAGTAAGCARLGARFRLRVGSSVFHRAMWRFATVTSLGFALTACGGGGDGGSTAPPAVTGVAVSPGSIALNGVGATNGVAASIAPANATGTISWRSANTTIATVTGTGTAATVTAVSGGTTQIIASMGNIEGRTTVTVTPIVRTITVPSATASVRVATSTTIVPTVTADAGANQSLQWESSAPSVATVNNNGMVTGVSVGSATITVSSIAFPSVTATVTLTVTAPSVQTVTVTPATATVVFPGTRQLSAAVSADNGANTTVDWTSSATGIATVSATGMVTAVAPGTATITARSQANTSVFGSATITVTMPDVSVAITPNNPRVLVGATQQLTANVTAANGVATTVIWGTTAPAIATVSNTGMVSAMSPGTATITATSTANPTVSASTSVTVATPTVTAIALQPTSSTVFVGGTRALTATVTADAGANTTLDWTSSDPAIATVSNTGVVTGVSAGGPITVTARSQSANTVSATAAVTVTPTTWTRIWSNSAIGAGGALSNQLSRHLWNGGLNSAIVLSGFQGGNLSASVGAWLLRSGSTMTLVTPPTETSRSPSPVAGNSPTDIMTFGSQASVVSGKRWNGSTFVDIAWPPGELSYTLPTSVSAAGNGKYFAVRLNGQVLKFDGTTWSVIATINNGTASGIGFTRIHALSEATAIVVSCYEGLAPLQLYRVVGTTVTTFPTPTSTSCHDDLSGNSESDLSMTTSQGIARWNGMTWQYVNNGLAAGETLRTATQCGSAVYAASSKGRVFRIDGNALTPIASDGEAMVAQNYTFLPLLKCASDGTLRAASGNSLLTRYVGPGWVDEHYAPDMYAVAFSHADRAIGTGINVVNEWTPTGGWRVRWRGAGAAFHGRSVWANADGSATLGGTINESVALTMTITANNIVQIDTLSNYSSVGALWRSSVNGVLYAAAAKPLGTSGGALLRRTTTNGPWEVAATLPNAITDISGVGAFAIAVSNGQMLRLNGTTWETVAGPTRPVAKVVAVSGSLMFGGTCQGSNDAIFTYNGTTWMEQNTTAVGAFGCVQSMWGTGASDVFALVGTTTQRVIHWDGSMWTSVVMDPMTTAAAGAGVPGVSIVVGRAGLARLGLPPAASIRSLVRGHNNF
jgi:uncharacterized protein YjdB